jgi:uncharacterized OB-fold protein
MGPEAHWRAALAEGRFLLQRDAVTGQAFFPPRAFAPGTGHEAHWFEASGEGEVYSLTHISRKPPEPPYHVVLVTLAEGPRMMSRVEGAEEVRIGMLVKARITQEDGQPLLVFVPA